MSGILWSLVSAPGWLMVRDGGHWRRTFCGGKEIEFNFEHIKSELLKRYLSGNIKKGDQYRSQKKNF